MYYLADGDVFLCCETEGLAEHLVKNGCHYVTEEEFKIGERRYRLSVRFKFALRELQARLLAGA